MQTYTSFNSFEWRNYQKALKEVATLRERNKKLNKKLKELRKEIKELKELAS